MKSRFLGGIKKCLKDKHFISMLFVFAILAVPTFAASKGGESITELDSWADKILELFQSSWVKAILLVALIVEAIGMVLAGQQGGGGQMLKKFAPWIIGTIILLCSSSICSYFLDDMTFEVSLNEGSQNENIAECKIQESDLPEESSFQIPQSA